MMNGAASIDSSIAATMSWEKSCSSNATDCAWTMSTRPNSPAWARARPSRRAAPGAAPNRRASAATSANLNATSRAVSAGTRKAGGDRPEVKPHAYGDEEQAQQHLAKRPDVLLDLVPVLGLGDEHPGEERAQGKRKPGALGEPGKPQRNEQDVEDEQLVRAAARHDVEPAAHQPLPDKEQQHSTTAA